MTPTAVALGNFDGVHQGHRQVIEPILNSTRACRDFAHSTVVTFNPHPQEFFTGESRCLLTPLDEKAIQLKALGVEQLVLLPFDRELASLSPEQFVQDILVNGLGARQVSVGLDFCFGKGRTGTVEDLKAIAARHGVEVMVAPLKLLNGDRISSSAIRHALQAGNIQHANYLLGRSYTLLGTVIHGQRLGRTLGFPTANLQLPTEKFLPCHGVYAVRVQVFPDKDALLAEPQPTLSGVMNLGYRPTIEGTQLTAEVHLFEWSEDLYGKVLSVRLEHFLRPEQKFTSLNALKAQIQADCEAARSLIYRGSDIRE